ncbi:hypothetical protein P5673_010538 [Acropora cervicornis]|uniref:Uncharacterized protein n=1 Tax=Acropora cervicornis TaxID=6130 RepID=A0AAD9V8Q7_ACRCE|nr:hypothetical protein P5673_010538 [Acropora cervicornis]
MAAATSFASPQMDWDAPDPITAFARFKQKCQLIFSKTLMTKKKGDDDDDEILTISTIQVDAMKDMWNSRHDPPEEAFVTLQIIQPEKKRWTQALVEKVRIYIESHVSLEERPTIRSKQDLMEMYPECFDGTIGCFDDDMYHITLDPEVPPVVHAPRRVPIQLKAKAKAKALKTQSAMFYLGRSREESKKILLGTCNPSTGKT